MTPPATAERSVAAALRIWFTPEFSLFIYFFSAIFSESSEPIGLKFGHDAWIGPEGDNKDFHRDSFYSFLIKNQKPPQLGSSHCTLLAGWHGYIENSTALVFQVRFRSIFFYLLRMKPAT